MKKVRDQSDSILNGGIVLILSIFGVLLLQFAIVNYVVNPIREKNKLHYTFVEKVYFDSSDRNDY